MNKEVSHTNNTPFYKKWWFLVTIVIVLLIGIGSSSSNSSDEPTMDNSEENSQQSDGEQTPKWQLHTAANSQMQQWSDVVDEVNVTVNENLGTEQDDDWIIIISANYNGKTTPRSKLADTLQAYCNTMATTLESQKNIVSEFMISWKVPELSDNTMAKCGYSRDGNTLVLTDSMGLLAQ